MFVYLWATLLGDFSCVAENAEREIRLKMESPEDCSDIVVDGAASLLHANMIGALRPLSKHLRS
jgi:hypothetical protein